MLAVGASVGDAEIPPIPYSVVRPDGGSVVGHVHLYPMQAESLEAHPMTKERA